MEYTEIENVVAEELPEEAQNIPQGKEPQLNPNPGYGEAGKTHPIKTEFVEGARGTPSEVVTPSAEGTKGIHEVYNFLKGLLIKGLPIEKYLDEHGGVTQEELDAAVLELKGLIHDADEIELFAKTVNDSAFTVTAEDFTKASSSKPAILTLTISGTKYDLIKTEVVANKVTFVSKDYVATFDKSGSTYSGSVSAVQPPRTDFVPDTFVVGGESVADGAEGVYQGAASVWASLVGDATYGSWNIGFNVPEAVVPEPNNGHYINLDHHFVRLILSPGDATSFLALLDKLVLGGDFDFFLPNVLEGEGNETVVLGYLNFAEELILTDSEFVQFRVPAHAPKLYSADEELRARRVFGPVYMDNIGVLDIKHTYYIELVVSVENSTPGIHVYFKRSDETVTRLYKHEITITDTNNTDSNIKFVTNYPHAFSFSSTTDLCKFLRTGQYSSVYYFVGQIRMGASRTVLVVCVSPAGAAKNQLLYMIDQSVAAVSASDLAVEDITSWTVGADTVTEL